MQTPPGPSRSESDEDAEATSTLSRRGQDLAARPSLYKRIKEVAGDVYSAENPNGMLNLGLAENATMQPEIIEFINDKFRLRPDDLRYGQGPWGTIELRKAMAKFMTKTFNAIEPLDPEKITFANGATVCCEMLAFTLGDPGDAILFPRPIYSAFKDDFGIRPKLKSVYANFGDMDQFSPEAVAKYEEAIDKSAAEGTKVCGIMLCNPHNPLGRCYPKLTIIELMKLCHKRKIHLISDELYAASVYNVPEKEALPFTSVLSFDFTPYISSDYVHIVYGMSKDFSANGLRLGCTYVQNKELLLAIQAFNVFHWPSTASQKMFQLMLEDEKWLEAFLNTTRDRLSHSNKLTKQILDDNGIKYYQGANAGFFLWVDFRPFLPTKQGSGPSWEAEKELKSRFEANKVHLSEGQSLTAEEPGWFRIIFCQEEDTLRAGLERVLKTIGKA